MTKRWNDIADAPQLRQKEWILELMQPNANTEVNRATKVDPAIKHTVPWQVTGVTALPGARLRVTFLDDTSGEVEMGRFSGALLWTVRCSRRSVIRLSSLRRRLFLVRFSGQNGADLAPDAMYDAIRERGALTLE